MRALSARHFPGSATPASSCATWWAATPTRPLDLAHQCVADGIETLVVVGGDGMVHLAVQALADSETRLGLIPAGTGNDVARYFDLPRNDTAAATDVVIGGKERRIDLARVGSKYFVTVLAAGFDAIVNERANEMTWPKGQMRYNLATAGRAAHLQADSLRRRDRRGAAPVRRDDGRGRQRPVVRRRAADHRGRGARRRPARRRGHPADEQARAAADLSRSCSRAPTSTTRDYRHHHAKQVTIAAPGITAYADGERIAALPLTVEVAPLALRVLVPEDAMTSSPAERYARSAATASTPAWPTSPPGCFTLDDFQLRACRELEEGRSVLVAAPTGSGKTIVGEFAVHLALESGRKAFYTTPIKALSNQKFNDLVKRYGAEKVGLLTGDNSINGEAPVVVMTTEVLRNMLYAGSRTLTGLGFVVMDEVHYLADRMRGAVWEEVIIHLPESVALASLSATVSNAEEFGEWLGTVRGETTTIVEERRPVPLYQHVIVGRRMFDLFADEAGTDRPRRPRTANHRSTRELVRVARDDWASGRMKDRRPARGGKRPNKGPGNTRAAWTPSRATSSTSSTAPGCCRRSCSSSAGWAATPPSSSA